jgi:hypothetical protein
VIKFVDLMATSYLVDGHYRCASSDPRDAEPCLPRWLLAEKDCSEDCNQYNAQLIYRCDLKGIGCEIAESPCAGCKAGQRQEDQAAEAQRGKRLPFTKHRHQNRQNDGNTYCAKNAAKSESCPSMPTLARIAVSAANIAESSGHICQLSIIASPRI